MEIVNLKPYLPHQFNLDNIVYSKVHYDTPTKKSIFIYDRMPGKKIYIQAPELKNMLRLIKKSKYYELNLPLYGDKKEKINSFIKFIKDLDAKVINDAKINKNSWFNESNGNIRYRSLIKNIHDDYIDTVEFKAGMFTNGIIKLKIIDGTQISLNGEICSPEELKLENDIRTIFQLYAIWISDDLFGIYLKPIKIDQKYKIIEMIDFIASESESEKDTVYNTDIENLTSSDEDEQKNILDYRKEKRFNIEDTLKNEECSSDEDRLSNEELSDYEQFSDKLLNHSNMKRLLSNRSRSTSESSKDPINLNSDSIDILIH